MKKKIVYVDMDGVIANFEKFIKDTDPSIDFTQPYEITSPKVHDFCQLHPFMFHALEPIEGAIETVTKLLNDPTFDVYFLSTPMWEVPESYSGKRLWLETYFGDLAKDRLILSRRKDLNIGHYLIDDTTRNGAGEFTGVHIHFGQEGFRTWIEVYNFLMQNK